MTRPGIEARFPGRLANTLSTRLTRWIYIYIYLCVCMCVCVCVCVWFVCESMARLLSWMSFTIPFIVSVDSSSLESCFLSIRCAQRSFEVRKIIERFVCLKNCLLTIDRFAYVGFCFYFFQKFNFQDHSKFFSRLNYALIFSPTWYGKNKPLI